MGIEGGSKAEACDVLQRVVEAADPDARVWRGAEVPTEEQGIKVLGAAIGHNDFVRRLLAKTLEKHQVLLDAIPIVPDVQSAWFFLFHCASCTSEIIIANCQTGVGGYFRSDT